MKLLPILTHKFKHKISPTNLINYKMVFPKLTDAKIYTPVHT